MSELDSQKGRRTDAAEPEWKEDRRYHGPGYEYRLVPQSAWIHDLILEYRLGDNKAMAITIMSDRPGKSPALVNERILVLRPGSKEHDVLIRIKPGDSRSEDSPRRSNLRTQSETGFPPGFTIRDEANAIVAMAFRNGPIENLHAGKRSPLLDDPSLSRITNPEMKDLMISACRQMEKVLRWKEANPEEYRQQIMFSSQYCTDWER